MLKLYFLNTLSPVLSTPLSYVCCVCMDRLMANFAGTCTSDNKGLLLLLLLRDCLTSKQLKCIYYYLENLTKIVTNFSEHFNFLHIFTYILTLHLKCVSYPLTNIE